MCECHFTIETFFYWVLLLMNHESPLNAIHLLADAFTQVPIGMLLVSLDGGIVRANPTFCQLSGYTEVQLRHLDLWSIIYPEDFEGVRRWLERSVDQDPAAAVPETLPLRYLHENGSIIWTDAQMILLPFSDDSIETEQQFLQIFVTDRSDQQKAKTFMRQQRERDALLNELAAQLQASRDVQAMMQIAVERLQRVLGVDRVLAYRLFADGSGVCQAEAVNPAYPSMQGRHFSTECIPPPYLDAYHSGRLWVAIDIQAASLAPCHVEMLESVSVRSMIATSIISLDNHLGSGTRTLWGLLVAHDCRTPRSWATEEQQFVQTVANQLAIALEQAMLLDELHQQTRELESRVQKRTQSLERSLRFEQLNRRLTESLRADLDDSQVLKTAVEGLVRALAVDGCTASLFDAERKTLEVSEEFFQDGMPERSQIGQTFPFSSGDDEHRRLLFLGKTLVFPQAAAAERVLAQAPASLSTAERNRLDSEAQAGAEILSPIWDAEGLLGVLSVVQWQPRDFDAEEVALVKHVATQCAIALRQSRLYRMEHEQRLSAAYFRTFVEKSVDRFAEYDAQLRYLSVNPVGCAMLARSESEILGKTNRELLGNDAALIEHILQQVLCYRQPTLIVYEITLPDDSPRKETTSNRVFEAAFTPILSPTGVVQRIVEVSRDITELKRQWQLLERQNHELIETTRMKEEFVATTSHELRTPLTAILGFSNVLLQEYFGALNPKQREYLDRIHASGQHLLDLINDILDLSRLEADRLDLELSRIFVPDLCEGVINLVQERALSQGINLQMDIAPGVDWLVADTRRLKQMLLNLLTNAVKFTPHGQVGLRVYCQPDRFSHPAWTKNLRAVSSEPNWVHFIVWDTGIGIDRADQSLLFTPFVQIDNALVRKHQGTGLGLVITRKLAELHGGSISLESQPGKGTQVTLSLPQRARF